jgi:NAD(P)-dependent dehydrogenase (short-subunit alcohol dehydrogenase family)
LTMRRVSPADGVAWITGASSGIGRGVALELARRGWTVAASARRQSELEALAAEAAGLRGRIVAHPADVTDPAQMRDAVAAIEIAHGPVALAFFNAGVAPYVNAPDLDVEAVRFAFDVNVMGVVHGLAAVMPLMAQRGFGQLAVNASVAGYGGLPRAAAYGATKAAMIHMCEALKFDCDRLGLVIQVVNPGFVETPLTAKNDFPMPFLMKNDEAARRVCNGFERGGFEITFPRRFAYLLKAINLLPYGLYFRLVGGMTGFRPDKRDNG